MRGGVRPSSVAVCRPARVAGRLGPRLGARSWSGTGALGRLKANPGTYATIPLVAAGVGFGTNWLGVKMLFYPIDYVGWEGWRLEDTPWGLVGWQGVVPTKTRQMAERLVEVITAKLLSLAEAFGRLDAAVRATQGRFNFTST